MAKKYVVAIDPGSVESGVILVRSEDCFPIAFTKMPNVGIFDFIYQDLMGLVDKEEINCFLGSDDVHIVIEKFQSYGMQVGQTTMNAIWWAGRFYEWALCCGLSVSQVFRKDVKMDLCGVMRAKDKNIKAALIERFATGQSNYGKGNKKNPGWFYGFKADIWSAYAVAVTLVDIWKGDSNGSEEDQSY